MTGTKKVQISGKKGIVPYTDYNSWLSPLIYLALQQDAWTRTRTKKACNILGQPPYLPWSSLTPGQATLLTLVKSYTRASHPTYLGQVLHQGKPPYLPWSSLTPGQATLLTLVKSYTRARPQMKTLRLAFTFVPSFPKCVYIYIYISTHTGIYIFLPTLVYIYISTHTGIYIYFYPHWYICYSDNVDLGILRNPSSNIVYNEGAISSDFMKSLDL